MTLEPSAGSARLAPISLLQTCQDHAIDPDCYIRRVLTHALLTNIPSALMTAATLKHRNGTTENDQRPNGQDTYAWTDGVQAVWNPSYNALPLPKKTYVALHELYHKQLLHPQRAKRIQVADPSTYDHQIMNIAADSVANEYCNEIARHKSHEALRIELAPGPWILSDLLAKDRDDSIKAGLPDPKHRPAGIWNVEQVYRWLKRRRDEGWARLEDLIRVHAQLSSDLVLDPEVEGETSDDRERRWNQEAQITRMAIQSRSAGDTAGGFFKTITGDLPEVSTNWQTVLPMLLKSALLRGKSPDHTRASRRWCAQTNGGLNPRNIGFDFATKRQKRATKLTIVVDVSFSIWAERSLLELLFANVRAVQRQTCSIITVLMVDTVVQGSPIILSPDAHCDIVGQINKSGVKGGGGTSFVPGIQAASDLDTDVMLYLTDLEGLFPDKAPLFPVIWGVPKPPDGRAIPTPPFGRTIRIN